MQTPEQLTQIAQATLRQNDRGGYTLPTDGLYPFQWNWDAGITALGWMTFDPERAWQEYETLFSGQWGAGHFGGANDGFLAQITFHQDSDTYFPGPDQWGTQSLKVRTSTICQPPLHATMLRWMWQAAIEPGKPLSIKAMAREHLAVLLPKVIAHHRWWYRCRDPHNTGLVVNIHPWETGMDNSPAWDEPLKAVPATDRAYVRKDLNHVDSSMRPPKAFYDRMVYLMDFINACNFDPARIYSECPYRVNDIGIICILQRASIDLIALCREFGLTLEAAEMRAHVDRTQVAAQALWSSRWGQYVSRDTLTGLLLDVPTSAGLLAAYAGFDNDCSATVEAWLQETRYALPSTRKVFENFEPLRYWRGPVWQHMNMLIAEGLKDRGYGYLAERIHQDSTELLQQHGFHEYYDPLTGAGLGGAAFSWTAATYLHWVSNPAPTGTPTGTHAVERTQRPWGWYETVSEVAGNKIKRIQVAPGQQLSLQKHHQRAEHWVVTRGTARVTLGDQTFDLAPGQHCDIAIGQVHRLANTTAEPVEIVEVQFGSYLGEDDIVRLQDDYGRSHTQP